MVDQPITRLGVTNFGPFASADLTFSPQINVFVGTNNTGKSMLLKLLSRTRDPLSGAWSALPLRHLRAPL
ncbi:AAA family ATPase [Actinomyces procaprae]|uniref:AAA family ATPase n=1 Tax=Actinomyces procaprae TaxID=2560010 RepID=UPI00109DE304